MSILAQIVGQETARYSDNLLPSFANFNEVFVWNEVSGGTNAVVINSNQKKYAGLYSCTITFQGTGQIKFNTGSTKLQCVAPKTGNYILSSRFNKNDATADITFLIEVVVNGVVVSTNTIEQNLYNTSGYVDGVWNCYFQNLELTQSDVVDFNFYAQSDTIGSVMYFDGFKLELDDRNLQFPSIYTETPLELISQENTLTIGTIANNTCYTAILTLTGAKPNDQIILKYSAELTNLGLLVGAPVVTSTNVVKVLILNNTGASVTPSEDIQFYPRVIR